MDKEIETMKMKDKVVIITGASRGIGKAFALGFAEEGADIVVTARTEVQKDEKLPGTIHETADMVRDLGRRAIAVKTDVSKEEDVNNMVQAAMDEFGKVDIMIHNAALAFWYKLWETPTKLWDLVYKVNLRGSFLCAKAVLPHMIEQKSGSILNISSPAGDMDTGVRGGMAYSASKAGVDRLSNGLAEEVKEYGISVNSLKPVDFIDTEGARYWSPPDTDFSKWSTPELFTKCAMFLTSQTSDGVTGRVFTEKAMEKEFDLDNF
jgi:NAD(P)-dependent dehydrogenase (short-subunit alcohol dehydrogenase family)